MTSSIRNMRGTLVLLTAVGGAMALSAVAQDSGSEASRAPVKSNAQIDAGEPRANSAPTLLEPAAPAPASPQVKPAAPSPALGVKSALKTPPAPRAAADRLNLNTATVTGDREQPKVMYIVPWKSSNIGDLSGKPMNSLLDEALAPVDRDVFKREVAYYDVVRADARQNGAPPAPAKQVEK